MPRLCFAFATLCVVIFPAHAEPPFGPVPNMVDHVVTMVERSPHSKNEVSVTITRHGRWVRIDRSESTRSTTGYFADEGAIAIRVYNNANQTEVSSISIQHGQDSLYEREPIDTGERDTWLGESCVVWEVMRAREPRSPRLRKLSCITGDGVTLWFRYTSSTSTRPGYEGARTEATKVERRPVAANGVQPPPTLLNLDWWSDAEIVPDGTRVAPDHETVMDLGGNTIHAGKVVRTTRHRHPWTFIEEKEGDTRQLLMVSHASRQLTLRYSTSFPHPGNIRQLTISRSPPLPPANTMTPKPINRSEAILGETCWLFDMMPGAMDAGQSICRTRDGVVLKENNSSWGSMTSWTAVRVQRRPVGLAEITPHSSVLDLSEWMREER